MSLIDVFPTDLSTSYRRLWDRVNQQQGSRRILAHAVLELLTFAQQPIKLDSMKRVLEQKTQVAGLYSDDINLGLILHACQGMVVYDERLDIFHLVHRSAHHFLEKTLDGQLAHTWLAEVCLQELLHFPSRSLSIPDNVDIWTADAVFIDTSLELALYAATSWYYHSHNCTPTLQCPEAVSAFLTNETALRLWIRLLDASDGVHNSKLRTLLGFLRAYPRTIDRLFLVSCFFGFDTLFTSALVSREISIGDDIILPSFDHIRRCISWVDQFREITGLEEIAEQYSGLTEDEAKEILEHSYHSNSLEYLFDISRLLGDVRCAGAICAAEQGHERIIKKLLEDLLMRNTLSVSQHDYLIFSCLRLASAGRHLSVLETIGASDLILWGHRTVPFSFVEGSMLGLSAFLGSREMLLYWKQKMVYLEEHIPLADLSFAVKRDDERATKLLLENFQVDINHRRVHPDWPFFREENTPLLVAAREGYHRVVEALLRHPEIDVNARDDFGNTALMRPGSNLVVAALCRHKHLNIHLRNQLGETALYYFIKTGSAGAIREMAKRPDFNVNERSYWRETPLIAAVRLGYDEVVRVLMRVPSIDLDACDEDGLNALDFADRAGHGFLRRLLSTHTDTTTETLEDCMENLSVALIRHPRSRT
ncbi:hypothetical protein VI817_007916 [Penicillium citrinum]|nr:hypothetical protein VI817_007916 [Penicillium citrinum]